MPMRAVFFDSGRLTNLGICSYAALDQEHLIDVVGKLDRVYGVGEVRY